MIPVQAPPPPAYLGKQYVWPLQTLVKDEKQVTGTEKSSGFKINIYSTHGGIFTSVRHRPL